MNGNNLLIKILKNILDYFYSDSKKDGDICFK